MKKENRWSVSRVLSSAHIMDRLPVIYPLHMSPHGSIVLPSSSSEQPSLCGRWYTRTFNFRNAQHGCHHPSGGLLPHLLTLTIACNGGYFLLHDLTLASYFPLRSGMLYVARTFLLQPFTSCQRQADLLLSKSKSTAFF